MNELHCGAQVKLVLTSTESSRKQISRKEIPHSSLDEIQPWMSLGWSWLAVHHTLSVQVKATGKLSKTVTVTSGLKVTASLFDNHSPFEMLWWRQPGQLWGAGLQTWVFISTEKQELLESMKSTDQHGPIVVCSHAAAFSALHTVQFC